MLLAINSGNTNAVFGLFDGEALRCRWRISTDSRRTADEYAVWLTQLMALSGLSREQVDGVIIASVVPESLYNLKALVRQYFNCEPLVIGDRDNRELGLKINVERPEEAGADRLMNAYYAHHRYRGPLIVVDIGTATNFDVVDGEGRYSGGAIAPGINLSLEALYMAASKLPNVAIRRPPAVIGKTTVTCMQSGIFWGYVGLIEGLVARIREEFGQPMKVVGTGGLATLFQGATSVMDHVDTDLTLHGLALFHRNSGTGAPAVA
jgi:type III pantothenate kinase